MLNFFNIKINFKSSFFVFMTVMALLNLQILFIILFLSVFVHEISHVVAANIFGVSCEKIVISPIGQVAILEGFDEINRIKKLIVVFAGPFVNFLIFLFFSFFENKILNITAYLNLAIGLFNLIPAYPLDGGRALRVFLAGFIGILNANKFVFKLSFIISFALLFLGLIQLILFPYNFSIICIAVYLIKINKKERINLTFEFYKSILKKRSQNTVLKNKIIKADIKSSAKSIFNKLSFDYNLKIELYDDNNFITTIDEETVLNEVFLNSKSSNSIQEKRVLQWLQR